MTGGGEGVRGDMAGKDGVKAEVDGYRTERDSLGEMRVPASALYGIQTQRALENFRFTGVTLGRFPEYIRALAEIKKAAALANRSLGLLDPAIAGAIVAACEEIVAGEHREHF